MNLVDEEVEAILHLVLEESIDSTVNDKEVVVNSVADWEIVKHCAGESDFIEYLYQLDHKLTATHGNQVSKCCLHTDGHKQSYGYYSCSSVRCRAVDTDTCSFQLKVILLLIVHVIYI